MRKIYYFMSVAAIALGLASCNKEEIDSAKGPLTIIANTESGIDTKTSLSGDDATGYQVLWSEGDVLHINDGTAFSLTEGAGTTRGTFVAEDIIEDDTYDVFYATNGNTLGSNSKYTGGNEITLAPMKAEVTIENGAVTSVSEFKNMCGLLRLTLKGSGTVREVRVIDDDPLYGRIDGILADGSVVVEPSDYLDEYTLRQICGECVDLSDEGTAFYFPLPPGDYTGIKIEVEDVFGNTVTKTMKSDKVINITRAMITPVNLTVSGLSIKPDVPAGALYGEFTVNADGKKVYFSRGNMYWDGDSFEFEDHQYVSPTGWNSARVGHFYWNKTDCVYHEGPIEDSWSVGDVLFTNNPEYPDRPNEDFTVNGIKGKFRVLSGDEWDYLFKHHSHKWVTILGKKGYVIAPDGVKLNLNKTSYSEYDLAAGNLVFIPAAGFRYSLGIMGTHVVESNMLGYYLLSSNAESDTEFVSLLKLDGDNSNENDRVVTGCSARLHFSACCIRPVTDKVEDSSL